MKPSFLLSSPKLLAVLRYGTLPLSWGIGGFIAGPIHLGLLVRGRWGHAGAACTIAFGLFLGTLLLGLAGSLETGDAVWNGILTQAALSTGLVAAVSYGAGVALRTAWNWQGEPRRAVALTACSLVALALVVNLVDGPAQEGRLKLAKAEAEGMTVAKADAFVREMAEEMERTGTPIDRETMNRLRQRVLSIGIEGDPVARLAARN